MPSGSPSPFVNFGKNETGDGPSQKRGLIAVSLYRRTPFVLAVDVRLLSVTSCSGTDNRIANNSVTMDSSSK